MFAAKILVHSARRARGNRSMGSLFGFFAGAKDVGDRSAGIVWLVGERRPEL